jgi:hypothetical protein
MANVSPHRGADVGAVTGMLSSTQTSTSTSVNIREPDGFQRPVVASAVISSRFPSHHAGDGVSWRLYPQYSPPIRLLH